MTRQNKSDIIIKKYGYVCKGGGSAYGGEWKPKDKNSARFLGKPNAIKENTVKTTKGSYKVLDYYDEEGKIAAERHLTDHNKAHQHSNPHDHLINWDNNFPKFHDKFNYFDNEAPSFEEFVNVHFGKVSDYITGDEKSMKNYEYNPADHKFETLAEFKIYLSCGANVGFKYNGIYYGIEGHNNNFEIWIYDKEDIAVGLTLEQTLDFEFDGVKLRDFITTDDVEITERIM